MNRIIYNTFTIFLLVLISCTKEVIEPIQTLEDTETNITVSLFNKWVLTDAWIYFENIETGQKSKYSHFDDNKTTSSIRYPSAINEIELIKKDTTKWEFTALKNGSNMYDFILNDHYTIAFKASNSFYSIIEHPGTQNGQDLQLGGSALPFTPWTEDGVNLKVLIFQAYTSIDNYNYNYFNILEFKPA